MLYTYYYSFLSCTTLYKWLSILVYVFVMHNSVRMTIHIILVFVMHSSVQMTIHIIFGFRHAHLCKNDYPYYFWLYSCTYLYKLRSILFLVFVMHISVQMTILIIFSFRHAHVCTNNYPYCFGFCHAIVCTNDYSFYFWFSLCTSLYEWIHFQCISIKRDYLHVDLLFFLG